MLFCNDRRKSNENNNTNYNNASLVRLVDSVDKNRAMRHDKASNYTSSEEIITNSKLKIYLSFQLTNTRLSYVRSKILPTSSQKKKIERSSNTQNTKYLQPRRQRTVNYPNQ